MRTFIDANPCSIYRPNALVTCEISSTTVESTTSFWIGGDSARRRYTPRRRERSFMGIAKKKMGRKERQAEQRGEKEAKRTAHMCLGILIGGLEAAKRV